ncbi:hypothetical protein K432DRAFT_429544 [Lepidopterella palustris CBS 459.81]|uniref:Zn(2)-C6 fungal-type domain-containing protein n=1 Tax=Lepidopterella palustris CBS 459.81 TaxID=1314670 RepID=A0A8E2JAX7_9PEZI|nr:hypothetical protein K432DRAFT_429544 [Lepidopterella palustris CBS 459.81]
MKKRSKSATTVGYSGQRKRQATPQLSCELCRERKVKCDKLEPCTNCASSGVVCVPIRRLRLPRGVHAHRSHPTSPPPPPAVHVHAHAAIAVNENLHKRIHRLEALVDSMGAATAKADTASEGSREQSVEGPDTQAIPSACASPTISSPADSKRTKKQSDLMQWPDHFWADLVEEIRDLRSVIESAPGKANEDSAQAPDSAQIDSPDGGIRVLGLWGSVNLPPVPRLFAPSRVALSHDKVAVSQLCQVYLRQVDPVIKILHRPSLEKWMLQGEGYQGYPKRHVSVETLSSAVCYSAASSMTENQCWAMFHASKSSVVTDCRRACEVAMERSGLLATRDITVLQAFVLYLVARRSEDRSRAVWTLIAVAVSIAKALCLYLDPDKEGGRSETFFDQQMRRRLWLTICLMDLQASFGQASEPLVGLEEAASSFTLPRHINDSDFDPATTHEVPDKEGLTDTTFALVTYHTQLGGRLLNFRGDGGSGRTVTSSSFNITSDREARQQHARRFEREALGLLHFCDPESSPYAWFTWHGTQCLVARTRLSALRPLQRTREGSQAPPLRMEGDTELLRLTLHVLEKAQLMNTDPRGEGFRWCAMIPWPVLAIAIAECYVCTDAALLRHAWPIVEASYQRHETGIARYSDGMLRGPLGKLMRRTREKLAAVLHSGHDASGNPSAGIAGSSAQVSHTILPRPNAGLSESLTDSPWATIISPASSDFAFGEAHAISTPLPPQRMWNPTSLSLESQPVLTARVPTAGPSPSQNVLGQSWGTWEEFVSGIFPDELASPSMFSYENNLGGY